MQASLLWLVTAPSNPLGVCASMENQRQMCKMWHATAQSSVLAHRGCLAGGGCWEHPDLIGNFFLAEVLVACVLKWFSKANANVRIIGNLKQWVWFQMSQFGVLLIVIKPAKSNGAAVQKRIASIRGKFRKWKHYRRTAAIKSDEKSHVSKYWLDCINVEQFGGISSIWKKHGFRCVGVSRKKVTP